MPFRFHCESCDVRIKVPDGSEGKKVRCPGCGQVQRVRGEQKEQKERGERGEPKKPAARKEDAHRDVNDEAPASAPGEADVSLPERNEALLAFLAETADAASTGEAAFTAEEPQNIHTAEEDATASPSPHAAADNAQPAADVVTGGVEGIAEDQVANIPTTDGRETDQPSVSESQPPASAINEAATQASADALKMEAVDVSEEGFEEASSQPGADEPVKRSVADAADEVASDEDGDEEPGSEAPAGEVRDLFDDFVRREELERQSEDESDDAQESTQPAGGSHSPRSLSVSASAGAEQEETIGKPKLHQPQVGEPVVVVKAPPAPPVPPVPPRVDRKTPVEAVAPAMSAAAAPPEQRPPQAIPLSPVKSARENVAAVAQPAAEDVADASEEDRRMMAAAAGVHAPLRAGAGASGGGAGAGGREEPRWSAPLLEASPPAARPRRMAPPPGYATLLALCWILRALACISLVSVVKLGLLWIDAGTKWLDVLIVAPLGLGLVIGIWAMGEIARAVRDTARNSHR